MKEQTSLPSVAEQAKRIVQLGVPQLLGQEPEQVISAAEVLGEDRDDALLVPTQIPRSYTDLMSLVTHQGRPGFVVEDFSDADEFVPVVGSSSKPLALPASPWYLLAGPQRGDEFENASPAEALQAISEQDRIALTISEGIFWLLQNPSVLERGHCFMTIGSRKPKDKPKGTFDARTPALWISNGTGRDGKQRRNAPKLGWCWWNNRHTWLGIAHAHARDSLSPGS